MLRAIQQVWPLPLSVLCLLGACEGCPTTSSLSPATAAVEVTPAVLDFGTDYVGNQRELVVTVRSTGTADVVGVQARVEGAAEFTVTPSNAARIGPGENAAFTVSWLALSAGMFTATLVVEVSTPQGTHRVALMGTSTEVPNCEDNNICTLNLFNTANGMCESSNISTPCVDGNACTRNDRCGDGVCLGAAVDCQDNNPCTLDGCEATLGCVHPLDPTRCADTNPCTVDVCDAVTGACSHPNALDGTQCAPLMGCSTMHLCVSGQCMPYQVPDGFPCEDGNLCTIGDACQSGVCTAQRPQTAPTVEATLFRFGGPGAQVVRVGPTRLVVADVPLLTVVDQDATGQLNVVSQMVVPGIDGYAWLTTLQDGTLVLLAGAPFPASGGRLLRFELQPGGVLVALPGAVDLTSTPSTLAGGQMQMVEHQGVLFVCSGGLQTYDLATGILLPVMGPAGMVQSCQHLWMAGANRLAVLLPQGASSEEQLVLDVSQPLSPVVVTQTGMVAGQVTRTVGHGWILRTRGNQMEVVDAATGAQLGQLPLMSSNAYCLTQGTVWSAAVVAATPDVPSRTVLDGYRLERGQFALVSRMILSQYAVTYQVDCAVDLVVARAHDLRFVDVTQPTAPFVVSGRQQGVMTLVAPGVDGVRAAGPQGVYPVSSAGAGWEWETPFLTPERTDIFRVDGPNGRHLVVGAEYANFQYPVGIWDVTDMANPLYAQVNASLQRTFSSGYALFWLTSDLALHRFPLDFAWPPGPSILTPVGAGLELPGEGHRTRHASDIRTSKDGTRLSWVTASPEGSNSLALLDVSGAGVTILGEVLLPATPGGVGMPALDSMVVLRNRDLTRYTLDAAQGTLLAGPTLVVGTPADYQPRILSYDGQTALLGFPDRIEFYQTVGTPQALGAIPTSQTVLDVTFQDNRLVAVSQNLLTVVSPPCPPPRFP